MAIEYYENCVFCVPIWHPHIKVFHIVHMPKSVFLLRGLPPHCVVRYTWALVSLTVALPVLQILNSHGLTNQSRQSNNWLCVLCLF